MMGYLPAHLAYKCQDHGIKSPSPGSRPELRAVTRTMKLTEESIFRNRGRAARTGKISKFDRAEEYNDTVILRPCGTVVACRFAENASWKFDLTLPPRALLDKQTRRSAPMM